MYDISLKELQEIELQLLKDFHEICMHNNFSYSLAGGTLLGAIRHTGFIPWDDDIDVMMPREDYNLFLDYCNKNKTKFKVINNYISKDYGYLFSKIYNPNTIIIEDNAKYTDSPIGIYVDVFPVDGMGNTKKEAMRLFNRTEFSRELLVASNWEKYKKSQTHKIAIEPIRLFFYFISRFSNKRSIINSIEKKIKVQNLKNTKYAGVLCGSYRKKEIMESSVFQNITTTYFCNEPVCIIKDYNKYLSHLYGNYMKLPPKEEQVSHHSFKASYK